MSKKTQEYNPLSVENYELISDWAKYTNARWDTHLAALLVLHGFILSGLFAALVRMSYHALDKVQSAI